jgi:hypothetical protein
VSGRAHSFKFTGLPHVQKGKGDIPMPTIKRGMLGARLAKLRAQSDDGARSNKIYQQILELRDELARLDKRKPPIDRSFYQQAWAIKLKRKDTR